MKPIALAILITLLLPVIAGEEPKGVDLVIHQKRPEAKVMFILPAGVETPRAVLVHGPHDKRQHSDRWVELCRQLGWAHMVVTIDLKKNRRPRRLYINMYETLEDFSKLLDLPSLTTIPVAPIGHSAGGMTLGASVRGGTDRVLTGATDCSWIYNAKGKEELQQAMEKIPLTFVIGSVPDAFDMIKAIDESYDPARIRGAPWNLGFEWGKAHKVGNSIALFCAWFQAMAEIRLSEAGNLQEVDATSGWRGSRTDWESTWPTVLPADKFPKEEEPNAVWLPNESFAHTWRAYQSTGSAWTITGVGPDDKALPSPSNQKTKQWVLEKNQEITLELSPVGEDDLAAPTKVAWYFGNTLIAEADSGTTSAKWTPTGPGVYVIHGRWGDDNSMNATKPVLVVVRSGFPIKKIDVEFGATTLPTEKE